MFVEKLTKEQIGEFLQEKKFSYFISSFMDENYLYVSTEKTNYRFYDFEGSSIPNEYKWRSFLYKIFGEEYKQAYERYLQEEMKCKISSLDDGE